METHVLSCLVFVFLSAVTQTCHSLKGEEDSGGKEQEPVAKNGSFPQQIPIPMELRLVQDLLERYPASRPLVRPVMNPLDSVLVSMQVHLIQILSFDQKNQAIQLMIWQQLAWTDEYMTWDPDDYGGITNIVIPAKTIWRPEIMLYSNIGRREVEQHQGNVQLILSHNGSVIMLPSLVYTSSCLVDMTHFPFDEQTCKLKFGPWTYSQQQMDLAMAGPARIVLTHYIPSTEWDILENTAVLSSLKYECCPERYVDITYTLRLRRNAGFHVKMLLLPTLLLSILVLVIWWIPPQRPDRTSLGMSLFSSFVLLLLVILGASPQTAAAHLGTFCCSSIVLVTLATIISTLVVNLASIKRPMPSTIRNIFVHFLGPKLRACAPPKKSLRTATQMESLTQNATEYAGPGKGLPSNNQQNEWIIVAAVFDRIFFLIYLVVIVMCIVFVFPWPGSWRSD